MSNSSDTNDKRLEPTISLMEPDAKASSALPPPSTSPAVAAASNEPKSEGSWKLRIGLLGMLSAQFASHTILVRYSRAVLHESYNPAAVVLLTEVLKVVTCIVALTFFKGTAASDAVNGEGSGENNNNGNGNANTGFKRIFQIVVNTPPPMLIPATSFFIQNVLAFVALKHLPPSVFVILSQLKIVFTTVFSVLLLNRRYYVGHWRSLILLIFATILVDPSASKTGAATGGNPFIGVLAVLSMAVLSGFSSVVLEKVLKGSPAVTIWERNLQLGTCSIVLALNSVAFSGAAGDVLRIFGLQSPATILIATASAIGGILVALVMRYADNVVKCFATAVGICVTSILSLFIFGEKANKLLVIGTGIVIISILNFNAEPPAVTVKPISSSFGMTPEIIAKFKKWYPALLLSGLVLALVIGTFTFN